VLYPLGLKLAHELGHLPVVRPFTPSTPFTPRSRTRFLILRLFGRDRARSEPPSLQLAWGCGAHSLSVERPTALGYVTTNAQKSRAARRARGRRGPRGHELIAGRSCYLAEQHAGCDGLRHLWRPSLRKPDRWVSTKLGSSSKPSSRLTASSLWCSAWMVWGFGTQGSAKYFGWVTRSPGLHLRPHHHADRCIF
jgi:hypothetical protein